MFGCGVNRTSGIIVCGSRPHDCSRARPIPEKPVPVRNALSSELSVRSKVADVFRAFPVEPGASAPEPVVPPEERRGTRDIHDEQCRWPIGDPKHADFHFCNYTKVAGLSYCQHHVKRAFQPPVVGERKRRGMEQTAPKRNVLERVE